MALSGSYDFSLTARQLITKAFRKCNIVGLGQDPSADQAEEARIQLNLMLKHWSMVMPHLWKKTEASVTLVADTASYSLAAANALRVYSARFRSSAGIDSPPLKLMTREEYFDLPQKTSTGIPSSYYPDPQRSALTLYIWPVMGSISAPAETLQLTTQKRFDDIDTLDDDIDVVPEWLHTVEYNFCSLLLDEYPVDGKESDRIIARAEILHQQAMDFEREDVLQFCPSEY